MSLIVSYEALLRYPVQPFSAEGVSAVTKLRSALPKEVVGELDELRRHLAVVEPMRDYEAPLLKALLSAALDGAHLQVTYDSIRSGASERVIFPFGLYASQGFWYCACFDRKRGANVSMRADRFIAAERVWGFERPPHVPPKHWPHGAGNPDEERVRVRARVTERGGRASSWPRSSRVAHDECGGGTVEAEIPPGELDYYASRLLSVGTDVIVESPPELVEAVRDKAREVARLYD